MLFWTNIDSKNAKLSSYSHSGSVFKGESIYIYVYIYLHIYDTVHMYIHIRDEDIKGMDNC